MAGFRSRVKGLRHVRAGDLRTHPKNWRTHPARQKAAMQSLLNEIGFAGALLARETKQGLQLIDGHLRAELDADAKVPVLVVDLSAREADKLLALFDPLGAMAEADPKKLAALVGELSFASDDLTRLTKELLSTEPAAIVEDDAPEPGKVAVTRPGDLWLLGEHRLLCGDSTKLADIFRLMRDDRAGLMNTDPPYGVNYKNEERPNSGKFARVAKPRVANDALCDERLQAFLLRAFRVAVQAALVENAAWYLWHAYLTQGFFAAAAAAAANVVLHRQIIWVKPRLVFTRGQYHWKHEPCFMGWVDGHQPPDYGSGNRERNQTTVWEIGGVPTNERRELNHATPKPVALFAIPIVKHTRAGEIVYEPFAGSGPQFIAAEQLNRRCYGLEIEPLYCDVIVERWQKFTGGKAVRETIASSNGRARRQPARPKRASAK